MSLDRSLKSRDTLARHRNVLTRAERIAYLNDIGKWEDGASPIGLPKVPHRKAHVGKKDKKEAKDTETTSAVGQEAASS
ncbi:MAG: small basic protein [Phycisphaerae bacterium]